MLCWHWVAAPDLARPNWEGSGLGSGSGRQVQVQVPQWTRIQGSMLRSRAIARGAGAALLKVSMVESLRPRGSTSYPTRNSSSNCNSSSNQQLLAAQVVINQKASEEQYRSRRGLATQCQWAQSAQTLPPHALESVHRRHFALRSADLGRIP